MPLLEHPPHRRLGQPPPVHHRGGGALGGRRPKKHADAEAAAACCTRCRLAHHPQQRRHQPRRRRPRHHGLGVGAREEGGFTVHGGLAEAIENADASRNGHDRRKAAPQQFVQHGQQHQQDDERDKGGDDAGAGAGGIVAAEEGEREEEGGGEVGRGDEPSDGDPRQRCLKIISCCENRVPGGQDGGAREEVDGVRGFVLVGRGKGGWKGKRRVARAPHSSSLLSHQRLPRQRPPRLQLRHGGHGVPPWNEKRRQEAPACRGTVCVGNGRGRRVVSTK